MAKQFSMGSPEYVAQFYGGDKQRIFQALQTGALATIAPPPYDQTVAIAAAAHIDRMNAAKAQGGANPPTVAEQVMGGASPTPPVPTPPAGGLGATPQAAPPMAPMTPPMPAPEGAPMGMADGGLVGIPVPETMFDEPDNGGYAGGGLVAFSEGGSLYRRPEDYDEFMSWARRIIQRESGGRYGIPNTEGSGAMGVGQVMPDTGRALAKVAGLEWRPDLMRGTSPAAKQYQNTITGLALREAWNSQGGNPQNASGYYFAGPDRTKWKGKTADYIAGTAGGARRASGSSSTASTTIDALAPPTDTLESGIPAAFKAAEDYYTKNMPERKNEGLGLLAEAARKTLDPAEREARRKEDMWMTLAEIGFNMASSNSPYLLQAASAAAAAALPGARAAKKEREAEKREAIRDLAAAEDITYKQAAEKTKFITDFAGMQLGLKKDDLARATNIWERMFSEKAATERTGMQIAGALAEQAAANAGTGGLSQTQTTDRLRMLANQYEDVIEKALTQDASKAYGDVERSQGEAGRIRASYNELARRAGMPELPMPDIGAFANYNKYVRERGAHPSGRTYTPQRGASGASSGQQRVVNVPWTQ